MLQLVVPADRQSVAPRWPLDVRIASEGGSGAAVVSSVVVRVSTASVATAGTPLLIDAGSEAGAGKRPSSTSAAGSLDSVAACCVARLISSSAIAPFFMSGQLRDR